jgi:ElaA protein
MGDTLEYDKVQFWYGSFEELNTSRLYAMLRLRSEVFVVEQDCVYQDIDNKDQFAWHMLMYVDGELSGYTRLFGPGQYFERASIGRVVVSELIRGRKLGRLLMERSIEELYRQYGQVDIEISAQQYLTRFYEELGFHAFGQGYLEDGIPHIRMLKCC